MVRADVTQESCRSVLWAAEAGAGDIRLQCTLPQGWAPRVLFLDNTNSQLLRTLIPPGAKSTQDRKGQGWASSSCEVTSGLSPMASPSSMPVTRWMAVVACQSS
jgi:hypothetical protein